MSNKLTILFAPVEGVGHVNACIGLAEGLRDRGHKVIFIVEKSFEGKLVPFGFEEELVEFQNAQDVEPGEEGANRLISLGLISGASPLEKIKIMTNEQFFAIYYDIAVATEPKIQAVVAKHNPDLFIIDHFVGSPTLIYSDKPWVLLNSANPLHALDDIRLPPPFSGYAMNGDKSDWTEFRDNYSKKLFEKLSIKYNKWLQKNGFPTIPDNRCIPDSPYLNIYGFPEELDYTDIRPIPDKWLRIDAFIRKGEEEFKLPDKLKERNENSKLIYLSLGSMGSIDVQLMKRLVQVLSKTEHKYIISKGYLGHKYELPDNMWGENSVPQTKVLPLVDLVITHGGNNTVTETFSLGKPMIVMPLFGDQFDNAQRIDEKGFGVRLDPYNCSDEELLNAIEKLLNDKQLSERLSVAYKRMSTSDSLTKACELIESLVKNNCD